VRAAMSSLRQRSFPSYGFPEQAAAALARAARYGARLGAPEGVTPVFTDIARERAAAILAGAHDRWLTPDEVGAVLGAYGVRTPRMAIAATADDAARYADELGYPLALKLASETITHKSDVGGVVLGLGSAAEVRAAFATVADRLTALGRRGEMDGVLLQPMIAPGVETFIGATRDPEFGHLLAFGIGGVNVELWKDVVFRVAPIRDVDAQAMIDGIRGRALLDGFRGAPPVDKAALVDALLRISQLVHDFPALVEIDLNPLVAHPRGAIAVDARIRVA